MLNYVRLWTKLAEERKNPEREVEASKFDADSRVRRLSKGTDLDV